MVFNLENGFLSAALEELEPQYRRINPNFRPGKLTLGSSTLTFMIIEDGQDKGKLTIAEKVDSVWVPHPEIRPVDYANLIRPGESLAEANRRVFLEGKGYQG